MEYNLNLIKRDSEFKYYFLGFMAADGWVSNKSNRMELVLKEEDISVLKLFRDMILPDKKIKNRIIAGKYKACRLTLENKELKDEVMKYINTTEKTKSLIFPYGIPDQYINHFIRGYIDGDGNIGVKRGQKIVDGTIRYYYGLRLRVLGTRAFLQGLVINLNRLCSNKINVNPHRKENENVYYVEFGFSSAKIVMDYVYKDATYYLDRKHKVFNHIISLDSNDLEKSYGKPEGCYNMRNAELCSVKI